MKDNSLDFKKAYSSANELLYSSEAIETFPFSPQKLVRENPIYVAEATQRQ